MATDDPFDLQRFVAAQNGCWEAVQAELRAGAKRSHWMWFVFPQLAGLGSSPTARFYAISGLDETRAYLAHPILGPRLAASVDLLLDHHDRSAHDIFGSPDDMKLRSSLTLFAEAGGGARFTGALDRFFDGMPDRRTLELLGR